MKTKYQKERDIKREKVVKDKNKVVAEDGLRYSEGEQRNRDIR